jgi:hypothetical protein
MSPEVVVAFDQPDLPATVASDVAVLLRSVPNRYLCGLRLVRLAAASELSRGRRRSHTKSRGRKVPIDCAAGLYHAACKNAPATIELFIDNMYRGVPRWVLFIPLFRRLFLASTLYHEIGHHIHRTMQPEHTEREDVADRWSGRLGRRFLYRRYWYLMPLIYPVVALGRAYRRLSGRHAAV